MADFGAFLITHQAWIWFAAGAILLTFELHSASGWLLWPAGSAFAVGAVTLLAPIGWAWAALMFAALTIVSTFVGRRLMSQAPRAPTEVNEPLARIVGHRGQVAAAFQAGLGRVFVDGKEWAAEAEGAGALAVGQPVEVIAVEGGARLKVRAA